MDTKRRILIVDDSESVREAVSLSLESAGYDVISAYDGQHGLKQLGTAGKVDLVISDLNMPNMDGISMVREIRKSNRAMFLPILILTTESQQTKRIEAKMAGATGWIIKPFTSDKLLEVVQKVMR